MAKIRRRDIPLEVTVPEHGESILLETRSTS